MHGKSPLTVEVAPVGRDGRYDDTVARFEIFDQRTDFINDSACFMTENHIRAFSERTLPNRVNIGCAWRHGQRTYDRIQRAAFGTSFFNPSCFSDSEHCETFHSSTSFGWFAEMRPPFYGRCESLSFKK